MSEDEKIEIEKTETEIADEQDRQALRGVSLGGAALPFGHDRLIELCRVAVPPDTARPWTVLLGEPPRVAAANESADIYRTYAEVTWGNGGVFARAEIDWRQGSQFCVVGSEVVVRMLAPSVAGVAAGLELERLYAFIAPGAMARNTLLTRTVYYGTIADTAFARLPVPPFAVRAWFACNYTTPTIFIGFQRNAAADLLLNTAMAATGNRNYLDEVCQFPIIVPAGATECTVSNSTGGAVDLENCQMIYELAL